MDTDKKKGGAKRKKGTSEEDGAQQRKKQVKKTNRETQQEKEHGIKNQCTNKRNIALTYQTSTRIALIALIVRAMVAPVRLH